MSVKVNKTIVLIGLMGAGKSSVGLRLARDLDLEFFDLDKVIEDHEKCSVSEIFEKKGEPYFRKREKEVVAELLARPPHVMATGGGAYMNKEIQEMLKKYAITVWLRADIDILVERVSRKSTRPLLEKGDKREILASLIDERYPVYKQADIIIDSDDKPHDNVVKKIISSLNDKKIIEKND